MNIRSRFQHVFKETFLDLFQNDALNPQNLDEALRQARSGLEGATDALAAFSVTHVHLVEELRHADAQIEALSEQLEHALAHNDDDQARSSIRKRQALQKERTLREERVAASRIQQQELNARVEDMKTQVLEIERKKLEIQLRERAADAIGQLNSSEVSIHQAHDQSISDAAETETLLKETTNQVADDQRTTIDSRLNKLVQDDEVEQELARLKQQRN
jgi:phage shock protein A